MRKVLIKGYSLIELSISITILSIVISSSLAIYSKYQNNYSEENTRQKMDIIEESLANFVRNNNYLPCPAPINAFENETTNGDFGVSNQSYQEGINFECVGDGATNILINNTGMVPVRTLNLPDEFAYDKWGNKFIYRIAKGFGNQTNFTKDKFKGDISIIDRAGLNKTAIHKEHPNNYGAAYILISLGPDGKGGWSFGNNSQLPLPDSSEDQYINVDHTNKIYIKDSAHTNYDDIVRFKTKEQLINKYYLTNPVTFSRRTCENAAFIIAKGGFNFTSPSTLNATEIANQIYSSAKAIDQLCRSDNRSCLMSPRNVMQGNLKRWLDGNDINFGISSFSDGSLIDKWYLKTIIDSDFTDISVNYAQSLANMPAYNISTNGNFVKDSIRFNGTNNNMTMPATFLNNTDFTIFIAVDPDTNIPKNSYILGSTNGFKLGFGQPGSPNKPSIFYTADGTNNKSLGIIVPEINNQTPLVISARLDTNNSSFNKGVNIHVYTKDGAEIVARDKSNITKLSSISNLYIGRDNIGNYFKGRIGEIIIYNTALDDSNRIKIVNYLKNKWFYNLCQ